MPLGSEEHITTIQSTLAVSLLTHHHTHSMQCVSLDDSLCSTFTPIAFPYPISRPSWRCIKSTEANLWVHKLFMLLICLRVQVLMLLYAARLHLSLWDCVYETISLPLPVEPCSSSLQVCIAPRGFIMFPDHRVVSKQSEHWHCWCVLKCYDWLDWACSARLDNHCRSLQDIIL